MNTKALEKKVEKWIVNLNAGGIIELPSYQFYHFAIAFMEIGNDKSKCDKLWNSINQRKGRNGIEVIYQTAVGFVY